MNYEWKDTVLADLFPYAPTTTLGDPSFKRPVSGAPGRQMLNWLSQPGTPIPKVLEALCQDARTKT